MARPWTTLRLSEAEIDLPKVVCHKVVKYWVTSQIKQNLENQADPFSGMADIIFETLEQ